MNAYNPFEPINARLNNLEALTLEVLQLLRSTNATSTDEIGGIKLAEEVTRLSSARIYTLVSERKIPHSKRGNRLTFSRSQLIKWLNEGSRIASDEPTSPSRPVRTKRSTTSA